jgi:hypothetical protein
MLVNGIEWNEQDVQMVEKFIDIKNRGYYVDGKQLTDYYNRLLGKHVNPTSCGSCLRQRVSELETALNHARELERQAAEKKPTEESKPETKKTKAKKKEE